MFLLTVLVGILIVLATYVLITQVIVPLVRGTKTFPAFRKADGIALKVNETREEVVVLREQAENLTELEKLLKQRKQLEEKIDALNTEQTKSTKE